MTSAVFDPGKARIARYVGIGAICGLTWAAGFRGWMAQLVGAESAFSWMTFALILVPGIAIGALLGWAAYLRSVGDRAPRWLVFTPVLFASALLDPEILAALFRNGEGGGALIVVATALSTAFVLSRRGWSVGRAVVALPALFGLLMLTGMGGMAAPLSTARGAWVCLYGFAFIALLCLASVLPYRRQRSHGPAWWLPALGALCGLAWACALRSFMAQVAGDESGVEWVNTFGFILLPGTVIGALLGWAEHVRRGGGRRGWRRLALAPLLFAAILFSNPFDIGGLLDDGVGGGAIGVPVIGMLGGYAVSGRGPVWARVVSGLGFLAGFTTWLLVATEVGGPSFSLTTTHGLWASTLYESLLVVLALGSAVPHLRVSASRAATARREVPGGGHLASEVTAS